MSYINPGNSGGGPVVGGTLLGGSATAAFTTSLWVMVLVGIAIGTIIAAGKFVPRFALESVKTDSGRRVRLTRNGRQIRRRRIK